MLWLCWLVLAIVLMPAHAWAWGPITHLTHGAEVLQNLTILSAALQQLLRRQRLPYLYGCVAADITQAKKYTRAQQAHCHSWKVGWAIIERAHTESERAFAYGYLTHLAGDVYSHNHFVPTQLIVSFRARTLRHVYWEARFDSEQLAVGRQLIRELRGYRFRECDQLVERVVSRTLFSFRTDKRIFNSFIAVHDLEQWHRIMQQVAARTRYPLPANLVTRYNSLCHTHIVDLLQHGPQSECQCADPTGLDAIELAKHVRRSLRLLQRRRRLTPAIKEELQRLDKRADLVPTEAALAAAGS